MGHYVFSLIGLKRILFTNIFSNALKAPPRGVLVCFRALLREPIRENSFKLFPLPVWTSGVGFRVSGFRVRLTDF